jgi:phenylalanine-4-hydroxylase
MSPRIPESAARQPVNEVEVTTDGQVVLGSDRKAIVKLDPNHPGFRDQKYRTRRNLIAQIALEHKPGEPVPDAPYTDDEHVVWETIWKELGPTHDELACQEYRENMGKMRFSRSQIPSMRSMSEQVQAMTGFRLEPVAGLVHPKVFLSTLSDGVFLTTQYIRHHSTPKYTPEPDVVHDLVGHACSLASPRMAQVNRLIGEAARRCTNEDDVLRISRLAWFTIEFGCIREDGQVKAYGAGLLSSYGELRHMAERAEIRAFEPERMEHQDYDVTRYQPILFCFDSFEDMCQRLGDYLKGWNVG